MADAEERIARLPIWSAAISIEPLHGGLSNESHRVCCAGEDFVVRFGQDFPFHHVSREREVMNARAAHEAGFSPEVVHTEPGVLVSRFIAGKTFSGEDVRANIAPIAELARRFHDTMARHVSGAGFMFWPFHVIRDYARTLAAGNSRMVPHLRGYLRLADELERAQIPLPIVYGHNDMLPANFIHDGARLWLIDFEYSGFSTAMFDLAGIASNGGFSDDDSAELLTLYFGGAPEHDVRRSHAAMQCASLLREAMWSMVSELHLDAPGADYVAYTKENLDRLDAALGRYRTSFEKARS